MAELINPVHKVLCSVHNGSGSLEGSPLVPIFHFKQPEGVSCRGENPFSAPPKTAPGKYGR